MESTIEESTTEKVPQHLQEIVERILSQNNLDSLQKDLFFTVIIVLMLENGFLPFDDDVAIQNPTASLDLQTLNKWKSSLGVFDATFVLNGFQTMPLKLIMSPLGATMLVNVIMLDNDFNGETYTVCLPISRYVVSPSASTVPMIFRDLKHLSVNFKNKIISAVKSRILSHCGYPSASLIGLPDDVLFKIALNLSICDIIKLMKTCNTIYNLMQNDVFWHDLCKRDFKDLAKSEDESSWKDMYKQGYIQEQMKPVRSIHNAAGSLHDYMDYSDYRAYIDNPMWDII